MQHRLCALYLIYVGCGDLSLSDQDVLLVLAYSLHKFLIYYISAEASRPSLSIFGPTSHRLRLPEQPRAVRVRSDPGVISMERGINEVNTVRGNGN